MKDEIDKMKQQMKKEFEEMKQGIKDEEQLSAVDPQVLNTKNNQEQSSIIVTGWVYPIFTTFFNPFRQGIYI